MKHSASLAVLCMVISSIFGNIPVFGQSNLDKLKAGYVQTENGTDVTGFSCRAQGKVLIDKSLVLSFPELDKTQLNYEWLQKKYHKFNVKKDNMDRFMLSKPIDGRYEFFVFNKLRYVCDMSEFSFAKSTRNMSIAESGEVQRASVAGTPKDYMDENLPFKGELTVAHKKNPAIQKSIPFTVSLSDSIEWNSNDGVFVVERIEGKNKTYCHVTELMSGTTWFVNYPFCIDASGKDGKNGQNGMSGANGINQYTYKDKDGVQHTTSGTCGSNGFDGKDGEDGGNGGHVVIYVADNLQQENIKVLTNAGKGGRGGRGGQGGCHGIGSFCGYGRADNGRNGKNGEDGLNGTSEILTISAKPISDFHASCESRIERPCVQLPLFPQKKRK